MHFSSSDISSLLAEGVASVIVALPDADDILENEAAEQLAKALSGAHIRLDRPTTGRTNLFAESAGVLELNVPAIDRLNAIDEAITFATLPHLRAVERGEMIGTVKIIPFAVPKSIFEKAISALGGESVISIWPFLPKRVAAISTLLPGLKTSVINKTIAVLEGRLAPAGVTVDTDIRIPHDREILAASLKEVIADGADIVIVFGASAITDRRDVIPSAIETAGGRILMLIGELHGKPVLGAPGCARSPKENGFDWVLQRLMADIAVHKSDITKLGVGGLLMEIVQRGHLRDPNAGPQD
jgi:molybdenum cofactor cytidylyltransferase